MPGNITPNFNLGNGARFVFSSFIFNDDLQELRFTVDLKTSVAAGDASVIRRPVDFLIKNGICTFMSRQATPAAGLAVSDPDRYFVMGTRTVPAGYSAAKTAERGAADTQAGRRQTMEAHVLSAGHIDPATLTYA